MEGKERAKSWKAPFSSTLLLPESWLLLLAFTFPSENELFHCCWHISWLKFFFFSEFYELRTDFFFPSTPFLLNVSLRALVNVHWTRKQCLNISMALFKKEEKNASLSHPTPANWFTPRIKENQTETETQPQPMGNHHICPLSFLSCKNGNSFLHSFLPLPPDDMAAKF